MLGALSSHEPHLGCRCSKELEGSQTAHGALACGEVSGNVSSLQGKHTLKQRCQSGAAQAAEKGGPLLT